MAWVRARDLVKQMTTTLGAGALTLGGSVPAFQTILDTVPDGSYFPYRVAGATQFETGVARRSGSTMVREIVFESSNAGAAVSFTDVEKEVALTTISACIEVGAQWFGTGADGDATISSGTTTLARDTYYRNLTLSGTGSIDTNGHRLFVSEVLNLDNAPANAIFCTPGATAKTVGSGGKAGTTSSDAEAGGNGGNGGGGGGVGGSSTPGKGGPAPTNAAGIGGTGGTGTSSGVGSGNGGGTAPSPVWRPAVDLITGVTLIKGGGSGGSNGTDAGTDDVAVRPGGNVLFVAARFISRGASTAAGCISAPGAAGQTAIDANDSGSGGSGGGWLYLLYQFLLGTSRAGALSAPGGTGGTGNGTGDGGGGGSGGRVTKINPVTGAFSETLGTAGGDGSGTTGGTAGTCSVAL